MDVFLFCIYSEFDEPCGCKGRKVDVPGVGQFWLYERICVGANRDASKENPVVVFLGDKAPVDLSRSDSEAESGYGFSLS